MDQFMLLVVGVLPILVIVLGFILCGISGFEFAGEDPRERKKVAIAGLLFVLLGTAGFAWKPLVLFYPSIFFGALLYFAFVGLVRVFKK